jgi:hypothetical protein
MFIGFGRSGHSIVGQIVNAHPNALIADEANIFEDLGTEPTLQQTLNYLIERDRAFALRWYNKDSPLHRGDPLRRLLKPRGKRRNFHFPGLSQGFVKLPSVVGNSKAGYTTRHVAEAPQLVPRFERAVGLPMKFVSLVRNPYDMIASGMRRRAAAFDDICSGFEHMASMLKSSLETLSEYPVLQLRQEDLLTDTDAEIDRLFSFLELPTSSEFKRIVRERLFSAPDRSRHKVPEVMQNRKRIDTLIESYDFFDGYTIES